MKNIAIICGGYSGEYQVSIESANTVLSNLDTGLYTPFIIIIEKDNWFYRDKDNYKHLVNREDFSLNISGRKLIFDGVFNAIHGTPGEDGKILAYFDLLGLPYTSSDMETSAITFDKYFCNKFAKAVGVNVANSFSFVRGDSIKKEDVIEGLGLPLFIKPTKSGSSVGVSKVNSVSEFDQAVAVAFRESNRIIIEEFIEGREIDCGLFEKNKEIVVLPLTEIITKNDFFDYNAKYKKGLAEEITPPIDLSIEHEKEIKTTSSLLYKALACKGIVRVDYILSNSKLYFLEINTVPGMSNSSLIPQQIKASGMHFAELISVLVENMFDGD